MTNQKTTRSLFSIALVVAIFASVSLRAAAKPEPVIIYLMSEEDPELPAEDLPDEPPVAPAPSVPTSQPTTKPTAKQKLDEIILSKATVKQKRILGHLLKEQQDFMKLMEDFISTKFNSKDDRAEPEFNRVRDRIVKLVFDAPDQRFYYERLYLINAYWLNHQDEISRFESLDRTLRNRWLELEEKRRRIRSIMTNGAAVLGAIGIGYFAYTRAMKIFPVVPNESAWGQIAKWAGRAPIILVGAGVGMYVGQYLGFLGSDLILRNQRDYLDPIDGTEDLQDLLDIVDGM